MDNKSNSLFWPSYVDLMINLFFIMLVLFVLSFVLYKKDRERLDDLVIEAKKAREIKSTISQLMENEDIFVYEEAYKRYRLSVDVEFARGKFQIIPSDLKNYTETSQGLIQAGKQLQELIENLLEKRKNQDASFENISYLIVISGRASKDKYKRNFELSYDRALALYRFWKENGIDLESNKFKEIIDIQIAGVGTEGIGRFSGLEEHRNQGFIIQIAPKIGEL